MFWRGRNEQSVEERLRKERPQPSKDLVRSIVGELGSRGPQTPKLRHAFGPAALTGALLLGLLAVGGLGYGGARIATVVTQLTGGSFSHGGGVTTVSGAAAVAQYGTTTTTTTATTTTATTTTATTTTATTTTTTATTTTPTTTTTPGTTTTTVTTPTTPGTTGTLTISVPPATGGSSNIVPPASLQVSYSSNTFGTSGPVSVTAAAATSVPAPTGTNNVAFVFNATDSNGNAIHTLSAILTFHLDAPCSYLPAIYENGGWRTLNDVGTASPTSADLGSTHDGYFRSSCTDGTGSFSIFTEHLSIFGIVSPANLTVSASGRKLQPAGSHKFGDAELVKPGAPTLNFVKAPTASAGKVTFAYYVNEQVSAYLHVFQGGKELHILAGKSVYRGHKLGGPARQTIHIGMIRPGTAYTTLAVRGLKAGAKVQIIVIDFDGNKVTKTLKVG